MTFHFTSDTDLQGHTLDVVIIWNCLLQKSANSSVFRSTFSVLLSHRDWLPVCQHLPGVFLFPTQPVHILTIWIVLSPLPLIPFYLCFCCLHPPKPSSRSVIQSVFSPVRSKQLNAAGESQIAEEIDTIRNWRFQRISKSFYLSLVTILSILVFLLLILLFDTKLIVILPRTWLEPLFLSVMPFFSPFLPLPVLLFLEDYLLYEASPTPQIGFSAPYQYAVPCVLVCLCHHNMIFLRGRDWDCFQRECLVNDS